MMEWWRAQQRWVWAGAEARGVAIAVIASIAGCGDGPYDHLADRAEEVRELQFLEDVPTRTLTPQQFADEVSRDVDEWSDQELRDYADTYGRLGFFDVNLDLRPIFTQSRIDATGAFYSPSKQSITFVGDPEDATVIHEYVHALQDQHFDLSAYDDGARTSDAYLARRAVVEGDAVLAEARFQVEERKDGSRLHKIDYDTYYNSLIQFSNDYLDNSPYPLIFRAYTSFVYTYGLMYSVRNLFGASPRVRQPAGPPYRWSEQDALFTTRPPATTSQILSVSEDPVSVGISAVPAALAADLTYMDSDSLGAWYAHLLFRPVTKAIYPPYLHELLGDRVLFARVNATGAVGVLWTSAWQFDAFEAEEVLRALHANTTEHVVIESRAGRVVLARNFPPSITPALVEAAFTGTATARRAGSAPLHAREAIRHVDHRAPRPARP
jgi:hypothetical protein